MPRKWIPNDPRKCTELTPYEKARLEYAMRVTLQVYESIHRKPKDKKDKSGDESEKGAKNESDNR